MKLARITGTVTATAKDSRLVGSKLMIVDQIDGGGKVLAPALIAVDTVGAGPDDTVLLACGSAARMAQGQSTLPVDLSIIAIVERINT